MSAGVSSIPGKCPRQVVTFRPDVDLLVGERYELLTAGKDTTDMVVSLKLLDTFINIELGAERDGAKFDPETQQRL